MQLEQLDRLKAAIAGRYDIEREIGSGGMATVYVARDVKHGRQVALKVLRPELAAALGPDRFLREIELAARLNHPHIVPLYDSGEADGFLFYVMPYIKGESLRPLLDREGQLPVDRALTLTRQVASALDHAHAHDVVHRDIKPENILLHEGVAMVTDFGIALAVTAASNRRLTTGGVWLGTADYVSPEQATGDEVVDARSDVYSLACVLFEMLAGQPPFTAPTSLAVITKRLTDPAPDVRRVRASVPTVIERALSKALAREPRDRFGSTGAFAEALVHTEPVQTKSRTIAVLPFLNLSADPENEYFADGITEDVIAQLSKIGALNVISRTSVMPFKRREQSLREISSRLEAATLLDGSVRRAGNRVRIVAQLVDAATERHLWGETYDRQLTDVFEIQTEVALNIAGALKAELSSDEEMRIGKEPTSDVEAYQLYLLGRHCLARYTFEGMHKAIEYFEAAIARDPNYGLAHAAIAKAYSELAVTGSIEPQQGYQRALASAQHALEIDSTLGDAHCILGEIKAVRDFDWPGADREFKRALELSPSSADAYDLYGRMCAALGRFDEAIALVKRAQELDPLAHRSDHANALLRAGRYDEALESARRSVEFDPHYDRARATLGWAYILKGMNAEGIAELQKAAALTPDNDAWSAQLGQAYAMCGQPEKAREVLRKLTAESGRYVSPYHLAYVYTGLGEYDRAMDWLEKAYEQRAGAISGIKSSFLFAPLRSHPRFIALLRKMHLA
jgi:eukaryotic-like serine/threonine-protein kinase